MDDLWQQRLGTWNIAEEHPDALAVVASPEGALRYRELTGRAHQVVHALRSRGLDYGDVVAFALPNGTDILVWQLAAQEAGWHYIALNTHLTGPEMWAIIEHSSAKAVVVHAQFADRASDLVTPGTNSLLVAVNGGIDGFVSAEDLLAGQPDTAPKDRRAGMPFTYTSGTTGKPKGIRRPLPAADPSDLADQAKLFGNAFRFRPFDGPHLVSAGMHHGGCASFYQGALNVGQGLVIMPRFEAEETLRLIERHRVTTAYMVPTQFVRLLRLPEAVRKRYDHSSLQCVVHSAAPCPFEIKKQMFDWWGPVIWETYGGMEAPATIAKPHRWLEKPGTVGRPIKGMDVMILDDDGDELARGEVGTVYLRPQNGGRFEYHGDDETTQSVYRGDAFTLGDMGYLDEDGYLFLCDRAKDLIITGGVNVYPAEVEGTLSSHPAVGDVAVIGVPDSEWGEQVKAVVELADGRDPSDQLADELIAFCRERLAHYKCPRSVDFRGDLPRTDTGKLYKRVIREDYWASVGRQL